MIDSDCSQCIEKCLYLIAQKVVIYYSGGKNRSLGWIVCVYLYMCFW